MREVDHKGEGKRSVVRLVWLPLVVALIVQYGLVASLAGAPSKKASDTTHAGTHSVTYEVSVTPSGQVLSSSARGDASDEATTAGSSNGSAAEAFLQAAGESAAVNALSSEARSTLESARARIAREVALAKKQKRQANKERIDKLHFSGLLKKAEGLKGIKVRGYDISDERMVQLVGNPPSYTSDIEYIDQNDLMPSGCEIVALTVVFHSMGYDDADPIRIADEYVEYGGDSAKYYTGTPYGDGGGFPPCIVKAANKWLKDNGGGAKAYDLTGSSFDALCALVELGYPVLVWTTDNMSEPYVSSEWYLPEHCVVMYGTEKAVVRKETSDSGEKSGGAAAQSNEASSEKSASSASASSVAAAKSSSSASSASSAAAARSASSSSSSTSSSTAASSAGASGSKSSSVSSASKSSSSASARSSGPADSSSNAARDKSGSSAGSSSSAASSKSASSTSSSPSGPAPSSSASSSKSSASAARASRSSAEETSSSAAAPSTSSSAASKKKANKGDTESSSSSSAAPAPEYAYVIVSDSLAGLVKRDYSDFKRIYEIAGKRALFIQPDNL